MSVKRSYNGYLRDHTTDMCDLQKDEDNCYIEFENWEEQMKNCPLREVLEELGEKCVACGKYTGEVNVKVCSKCASEYRF